MTEFVFPPPARTIVAVAGERAAFPVRRIYCVGRNYAAHAKEMGGDLRDPPFFFQKPTDAIVPDGATVPYPPYSDDVHYEVELVLALGLAGVNIPVEKAHEHVYGSAVGIDLTRRDRQSQAREKGQPWAIAKGFDYSAPISALTPLTGALPTAGRISLTLNGEIRQDADLADLIWNCAEVISTLSQQYALAAGDLIFTGTPAGVGAVQPGDTLIGQVAGLSTLQLTIGQRADAYSAGAGAA